MIIRDKSGEPRFAEDVDPVKVIEMLESSTRSVRWHEFMIGFEVFWSGVGLCVEMIHHLGDVPPQNENDTRLRDLVCDALDTAWLSGHALLHGYDNQSVVLLRRTFEELSLIAYFINFPEEMSAWEKGKEISPAHVRKRLDNAPLREPGENLKNAYKEFCAYTHVNSDTVAHRYLGAPNRFTLGCQGNCDPVMTAFSLQNLLGQIAWLVSITNFIFKDEGKKIQNDYIARVLKFRSEVARADDWLSQTVSMVPDGKRDSDKMPGQIH